MRSAYRTLYRSTLWFGVQQRVPLRAYLRSRFMQPAQVSEPELCKTIEFVDAAAKRHGLERRIVAGLAEHLASYHRLQSRKSKVKPAMQKQLAFNKELYRHMLAKLNETHGICL